MFFLNFLLKSVGVDPVHFRSLHNPSEPQAFRNLVEDIDRVLSKHGKKWVFIFDQINAIFAREEFKNVRDVTKLKFPFSLMHAVMKKGRIISVISASANNDVSHRDNHPGFEDFDHFTKFNEDEIKLLYPASEVAR